MAGSSALVAITTTWNLYRKIAEWVSPGGIADDVRVVMGWVLPVTITVSTVLIAFCLAVILWAIYPPAFNWIRDRLGRFNQWVEEWRGIALLAVVFMVLVLFLNFAIRQNIELAKRFQSLQTSVMAETKALKATVLAETDIASCNKKLEQMTESYKAGFQQVANCELSQDRLMSESNKLRGQLGKLTELGAQLGACKESLGEAREALQRYGAVYGPVPTGRR